MRFSILTPTLDRPEFLARAVASVDAQTWTDWEHIIVDVGTVPAEIAPHPQRRVWRKPAEGPAIDFQAALDLAAGDVVHPLADDDRLPPHALETVAAHLGAAEWLVATTAICSEDGEHQDYRGGNPHHVAQTRAGSYMLGGAVYWRKRLSDLVGGFNDAYTGAADFDLYLRFLKQADPVVVDDVLYLYTDHPLTDTRLNATRQSDASRRLVEEHLG